MPKNLFILALLALIVAISAGMLLPAAAEFSGSSPSTHELAAQSRPRITIHPRRIHPGPNAKRYCRSWLAKEYRVSGPVIVPQMRCWWE
jgi:hypothetical protein